MDDAQIWATLAVVASLIVALAGITWRAIELANSRMTNVEGRVTSLETRLIESQSTLEVRVTRSLGNLQTDVTERLAEMRGEMYEVEKAALGLGQQVGHLRDDFRTEYARRREDDTGD